MSHLHFSDKMPRAAINFAAAHSREQIKRRLQSPLKEQFHFVII